MRGFFIIYDLRFTIYDLGIMANSGGQAYGPRFRGDDNRFTLHGSRFTNGLYSSSLYSFRLKGAHSPISATERVV